MHLYTLCTTMRDEVKNLNSSDARKLVETKYMAPNSSLFDSEMLLEIAEKFIAKEMSLQVFLEELGSIGKALKVKWEKLGQPHTREEWNTRYEITNHVLFPDVARGINWLMTFGISAEEIREADWRKFDMNSLRYDVVSILGLDSVEDLMETHGIEWVYRHGLMLESDNPADYHILTALWITALEDIK